MEMDKARTTKWKIVCGRVVRCRTYEKKRVEYDAGKGGGVRKKGMRKDSAKWHHAKWIDRVRKSQDRNRWRNLSTV